ncbi:hypothetical protein SK128_001144 [Halocaridina rubra]|uniref:Uncharacterized protein n=1 Tax=Halocaridina rubra TaxID=373956 RepID=A0AAN9ADQ9_HALRR
MDITVTLNMQAFKSLHTKSPRTFAEKSLLAKRYFTLMGTHSLNTLPQEYLRHGVWRLVHSFRMLFPYIKYPQIVFLYYANGTYEFGYDTRGARTGARFFRHEEKGTDGRVRGQYGFVDANGDLHVIIYVTDALGHRIRTETHKIEGYGHELTRILETGSSSADVKDQINTILKGKTSSASTLAETTNTLETTTPGQHRTTRSTQLPTGPEPYFDDAEPSLASEMPTDDSDEEPKEETHTSAIVALRPTVNPLQKQQISRTHTTVTIQPLRFRRPNELPYRPINSHASTQPPAPLSISPQPQNLEYRNSNANPTPTPEFPPPPTFPTTEAPTAKVITTPSGHFAPQLNQFQNDDMPVVTTDSPLPIPTSSSIPWTLNIPISQTEPLSSEHFQQIREHLKQILNGNEKQTNEMIFDNIKLINAVDILDSLGSIITAAQDTNGKNLAFFINPNTSPKSQTNDDNIIDGGIIDGGIINPEALQVDTVSTQRSQNIIDGGVIDGGVINNAVNAEEQDLNDNNRINDNADNVFNEGIVNGEIIDADGNNIRDVGKNGDDDTTKNLLALEKLLHSENAQTFLSLLNLEKVLQSDKVDSVTKSLIFESALASGDSDTLQGLLTLKDILMPKLMSHSEQAVQNQKELINNEPAEFRENVQRFLNSDDTTQHFMTTQDILVSNDENQVQTMTNIQKQIGTNFDLADSMHENAENNPSVIDQLIAFHRPAFPDTINNVTPQLITANQHMQTDTPQQTNANQISSEIFAPVPTFQETNTHGRLFINENAAGNRENNVSDQDINNGGNQNGQSNNQSDETQSQIPTGLGINVQETPTFPSSTTVRPGIIPKNIQRNPQVITSKPATISTPEVLHYIPSPNLATDKPDSQQLKPPTVPSSDRNLEIPNIIVGLNTDSEDMDSSEESSEEYDKNVNIIAPSDHKENIQSSLAIRPVSVNSLTPNGSPVFINSTVYFTTTALPRVQSLENNQPRISRPDLARGFRPIRPSTYFHSRPRLTKSKSVVSFQVPGHLSSQANSQHDENHANIQISQNGNSIEVIQGGLSAKSNTQEQARGVLSADIPTDEDFIIGVTPIPETSTLATLLPDVTSYFSSVDTIQQSNPLPTEATVTQAPAKPLSESLVSTLPKPPPIIENLPPIHITTIVPTKLKPINGPTLPARKLTTLPPSRGKNVLTPVPVPTVPPSHPINNADHSVTIAPHITATPRVNPTQPATPLANKPPPPSSSHFAVHGASPVPIIPHSPPHSPPQFGPTLPPSPPTAFPRNHVNGSPPHLAHKSKFPFVPVHTPTHIISAGPHHLFVQHTLPGPVPTTPIPDIRSLVHTTGNAHTDVVPVLHSGPPLIPPHRPVIHPGRSLNNGFTFRNYRLQRRQDSRT